jgi:hypothetical protein
MSDAVACRERKGDRFPQAQSPSLGCRGGEIRRSEGTFQRSVRLLSDASEQAWSALAACLSMSAHGRIDTDAGLELAFGCQYRRGIA